MVTSASAASVPTTSTARRTDSCRTGSVLTDFAAGSRAPFCCGFDPVHRSEHAAAVSKTTDRSTGLGIEVRSYSKRMARAGRDGSVPDDQGPIEGAFEPLVEILGQPGGEHGNPQRDVAIHLRANRDRLTAWTPR